MNIRVLSSNSKGNCAVIKLDGGKFFMIDAGISASQLIARTARMGVHPQDIAGILITHEHADHAQGIKGFVQKFDIPVFANELTAGAIESQFGFSLEWSLFETGLPFGLAGAHVIPFAVPHDAVEPVGFCVSENGDRLAFISDCGQVTEAMLAACHGAKKLIIEANYDLDMLRADESRPWKTKRRIVSVNGHLDNKDAASAILALAPGGLESVILGHLSQQCNSPALAIAETQFALEGTGFERIAVSCAK